MPKTSGLRGVRGAGFGGVWLPARRDTIPPQDGILHHFLDVPHNPSGGRA